MHDPVADSGNLVNVFQYTMDRVCNRFDEQIDGILVIGAVLFVMISFHGRELHA